MSNSFETSWTVACQTLSVHGISQARILQWVSVFFSRGSSWPLDQSCCFCLGTQVVYHWAATEALSSNDEAWFMCDHNRQVWPWSTMKQGWGQQFAVRRQGHTPLQQTPSSNSTRHGSHVDVTEWAAPTQTDPTLCSWRQRSSIQEQEQDQELTVAHIMNSLLTNSDLNLGKPLGHSGMT